MPCFENRLKVLHKLATSLLLSSSVAIAEQSDNSFQQAVPSEAFLEYLAQMSEVNGKMSDPLEMLEIAEANLDEELINNQPEAAATTQIPVSELLQGEKAQ